MNRISTDGQSQNMLISVEMYIFDQRALSCLSAYTWQLAQGAGRSRNPLHIYLELGTVPVLDALRGTVQRRKRFRCASDDREDRLKGQPAHCWFPRCQAKRTHFMISSGKSGSWSRTRRRKRVSCTKGAISGFVFHGRRLGGCKSQICCWGLLRVRTMPAASCPEHPTAMQVGEGGGKGCPGGAQSSPATSFPSCVQPLWSLGVIYLQSWRVSNYESIVRWVEWFSFSVSQMRKLRLIELFIIIAATTTTV